MAETPEEIKKKLYNYNLLDGYFIDEDVASSVGEIFQYPIDGKVTLADREMGFQLLKMKTAVEKIYKGYLAASSKDAYVKQFELYPMKDFDEHMAALGAVRTSDDVDFAPTGEVIDWVAKVKKELKKRNEDFEKNKQKEEEKKQQEEIEESIKKSEEVKNKTKEQIEKSGGIIKPETPEGWQDLAKNLVNLTKGELLNDQQKSIKNAEEKNKLLASQQDDNPNSTLNDATSKQIEANNEIIKRSKEKQKEMIKGKSIDEDTQKKITEGMETNVWNIKVNKEFSGFTTQGPFCIQKRNYFRNVFRPSISHFNTEFREAVHHKQKVRDEQNSKTLKPLKHKKGEVPFSVTEETNTSNITQQGEQLNQDLLQQNTILKPYYDKLGDGEKTSLNELSGLVSDLYDYIKTKAQALSIWKDLPQDVKDLTKQQFASRCINAMIQSFNKNPEELDAIKTFVGVFKGLLSDLDRAEFLKKVTAIYDKANSITNTVVQKIFGN